MNCHAEGTSYRSARSEDLLQGFFHVFGDNFFKHIQEGINATVSVFREIHGRQNVRSLLGSL